MCIYLLVFWSFILMGFNAICRAVSWLFDFRFLALLSCTDWSIYRVLTICRAHLKPTWFVYPQMLWGTSFWSNILVDRLQICHCVEKSLARDAKIILITIVYYLTFITIKFANSNTLKIYLRKIKACESIDCIWDHYKNLDNLKGYAQENMRSQFLYYNLHIGRYLW